jgi:hypothetical protein
VINTCTTEKVQATLLLEQSLGNVWRKRAFAGLPQGAGADVDVFRERIDYSVDNSIPKPKSFTGRLEQMVRENSRLLTDAQDRAVVESLLGSARTAEGEHDAAPVVRRRRVHIAELTQGVRVGLQAVPVAGVEGDGSADEVARERAFNAEQEQEQEQEQGA